MICKECQCSEENENNFMIIPRKNLDGIVLCDACYIDISMNMSEALDDRNTMNELRYWSLGV